jgi:5-methylthioadenosine/S-adenosylhomocysteine deaminase
MPSQTLYRARHVFPVSGPAHTDSAVVVEGDRIVAVGPASSLVVAYPAARQIDLGESALFPAAVNAHTHLELTGMAGALPEGLSFAEWVVALVRARRTLTQDDYVRAAERGVAAVLASGTAAVGEITTYGASVRPIVESDLGGVIYYELLGVDPASAPALLARGQRQVAQWRQEYAGAQVQFGLSLHAPYTVSAELFRLTARWCADQGVPLSIHAAESPVETQWLASGSGAIADVLYTAAGWSVNPALAPGCSPIAYLDSLGVLAAQPLLAHGVQVSDDDVHRLAWTGSAVAHCPRSNTHLGCGRLPYRSYRAARVRLGLGTDSLASSPSLSIWDELAAAYAVHSAGGESPDPRDLLRLATLSAAEALGVDGEVGSLDVGKRARLACAPLTSLSSSEAEDPESILLALAQGRIIPGPVAS